MKNKLKYLSPLAIVFLTPLMHHAAFENIRQAIPDMAVERSHFMAFFLCVMGCLIGFFVSTGII